MRHSNGLSPSARGWPHIRETDRYIEPPPSDLEDERKTITALFADLKGSTSLIEGLDPEAARALLDPALAVMMDAVRRYEGSVAQGLGDGIYALFGAPLAVEDHPQRALHAAIAAEMSGADPTLPSELPKKARAC